MIERDGETVRLRQNPRVTMAVRATLLLFGAAAGGLGVLAAVGPLLGLSAWVEILAVIFIGTAVFVIVVTLRDRDLEVLELDATTLRLRRGDDVLQSMNRTSIASLDNFVSAGQGGAKTSVLLTACDEHGDIVAQWSMDTAWSKKQFDEFLEATGIPDRIQR